MKLLAQLSGIALLLILLVESSFFSTCSASVLPQDYFNVIDKICKENYASYIVGTDSSNASIVQTQAYERCITQKCVVTLSSAWSKNSVLDHKGVESIYDKLDANFSSEFAFNVYAKTIDELYNMVAAELLAQQLQLSYLEYSEKSLQVTLEAQLYLFWKYHSRHDLNDRYLLLAAYYMHELHSDALFALVQPSLRTRFAAMLRELPTSLRYFFFKPQFCLQNKLHKYFLYTTIPNGFEEQHIKHVFLWQDNSAVGPSGIFEKIEVQDDAEYFEAENLKFILKGKDLGFPLYIEDQHEKHHNLVAAWRYTNATAPNREWSVTLTDNQLVFSQHDRKMCASGMTNDASRRFIYALNEMISNEACQWIAGECE